MVTKPLKITALGDSHVSGESFVKHAAKHMGAEFVDMGVVGERTAQIRARAAAAPEDSDVVVLMAGANDIADAPWHGLALFDEHYPMIVDELSRPGRKLVLCTLIPYSNLHEDHIIRAMNGIVRRCHEQRPGTALFDAHASLLNSAGSIGNQFDYGSFAHLSPRGNCYLGAILRLTLQRFVSAAQSVRLREVKA